jgi:hypothetical protein
MISKTKKAQLRATVKAEIAQAQSEQVQSAPQYQGRAIVAQIQKKGQEAPFIMTFDTSDVKVDIDKKTIQVKLLSFSGVGYIIMDCLLNISNARFAKGLPSGGTLPIDHADLVKLLKDEVWASFSSLPSQKGYYSTLGIVSKGATPIYTRQGWNNDACQKLELEG